MGRPRKVKATGKVARQIRRVVGYIRASTIMQVDDGYSLDEQWRQIEAAFERDTIADRVTAGMAEKARPPYSDALEPAALVEGDASSRRKRSVPLRQTVVVEEHAAVVRRIFAARSASATIAAIGDGLNLGGIPGPNGGRWVVSRVYGIVANPYYAGQVRFNERSARAAIIAAATDHEAIIDDDAFRRAPGPAA